MFAVMQVLAVSIIIYYSTVLDYPNEKKSRQRSRNQLPQKDDGEEIRNSRAYMFTNRTDRKPKTIVIFLHIHKCAGTFFINMIQSLPNQHVPPNNGLLQCPPLNFRSVQLQRTCGSSKQALLPFWIWPAAVQKTFFQKLNYTFVANERWLGRDVVSSPLSSTAFASYSTSIKYVTIIRHPLDRIASHFHYAQRYPASALYGRNLSFSSFVRAGPCRVPDAGFACWDANHFVQVPRPHSAQRLLPLGHPHTTHPLEN